MSKLHISVVVPAFNEEKFLASCLNALMSQTQQADVIYLIDNNSTDATVAIAKNYSKVVVIKETTQGICAATFRGLNEAAKYEGVILRCDADCIPPSNWIEQLIQDFNNNPSVAAVTGPGVAYDTNSFFRILIDKLYMKPYFFITSLALGYTPLFGSNFAIKSEAWKNIANHTHLSKHQDIHDDMDISFHIKDKIHYNPSLIMPISARPFRSIRSLLTRYNAGFRTVFLHWPKQAPWQRFVKNKK